MCLHSTCEISIITVSGDEGSRKMIQRRVNEAFKQDGYRILPGNSQAIKVYYRYYQERFHVIVAVNQTKGFVMHPEHQQQMQEWVLNNFYHPQAILPDFSEDFPVYSVEVLTLLIGGEDEQTKDMCSVCQNTWVYRPEIRRVFIYENQPGEFYGLRAVLENIDMFSSKGKKRMPYVTVAIIGLNCMVYLLMELFGSTYDVAFVAQYGAMYPLFLLEERQWWRLLTAGFVHFGMRHLANNMLLLYTMGERLEQAVGSVKMLSIYLVSLLVGNIVSYIKMLQTGHYAVAAGASGAVYGIIGAALWVLIVHRGRWGDLTAKRLVLCIVLMICTGFTTVGIDNAAHMGGLIAGFVITAILYHRKHQKC